MPCEFSACVLCAGCCSAACLLAVCACVVCWLLTWCVAGLVDSRLPRVRLAPRELLHEARKMPCEFQHACSALVVVCRLFACSLRLCRLLVAHVVCCWSC